MQVVLRGSSLTIQKFALSSGVFTQKFASLHKTKNNYHENHRYVLFAFNAFFADVV